MAEISSTSESIFSEDRDVNVVKQLEELRKQLLKHVQPRLAWEVTLLEIKLFA